MPAEPYPPALQSWEPQADRGWRAEFLETLTMLFRALASGAPGLERLREVCAKFEAGSRLAAAELAWVEEARTEAVYRASEARRHPPPPEPAPPFEPADPILRAEARVRALEPRPEPALELSAEERSMILARRRELGVRGSGEARSAPVVAPSVASEEPGTWEPPYVDAEAEYAAQLAWMNLHPDEVPPWA